MNSYRECECEFIFYLFLVQSKQKIVDSVPASDFTLRNTFAGHTAFDDSTNRMDLLKSSVCYYHLFKEEDFPLTIRV